MPDRKYMLRLPWPDKALSPNASNGTKWQRMKAYSAKKKARGDTWAATTAIGAHLQDWADGADLRFDFYPPDRRKRDIQNMPAMFKGHIDGIADALGVDDSLFRLYWPPEFSEPIGGGVVLVTIAPRVVEVPLRGVVT